MRSNQNRHFAKKQKKNNKKKQYVIENASLPDTNREPCLK